MYSREGKQYHRRSVLRCLISERCGAVPCTDYNRSRIARLNVLLVPPSCKKSNFAIAHKDSARVGSRSLLRALRRPTRLIRTGLSPGLDIPQVVCTHATRRRLQNIKLIVTPILVASWTCTPTNGVFSHGLAHFCEAFLPSHESTYLLVNQYSHRE